MRALIIDIRAEGTHALAIEIIDEGEEFRYGDTYEDAEEQPLSDEARGMLKNLIEQIRKDSDGN